MMQSQLKYRNATTVQMRSNDSSTYTAKRTLPKTKKVPGEKGTDNDSLFDAIVNNNYQRVQMIQKKNEALFSKIGSSNIKNFSQKKLRPGSKDKRSRRNRNSPTGHYKTKHNESILDMILDASPGSRHSPKRRSPTRDKKTAQPATLDSTLLPHEYSPRGRASVDARTVQDSDDSYEEIREKVHTINQGKRNDGKAAASLGGSLAAHHKQGHSQSPTDPTKIFQTASTFLSIVLKDQTRQGLRE